MNDLRDRMEKLSFREKLSISAGNIFSAKIAAEHKTEEGII